MIYAENQEMIKDPKLGHNRCITRPKQGELSLCQTTLAAIVLLSYDNNMIMKKLRKFK